LFKIKINLIIDSKHLKYKNSGFLNYQIKEGLLGNKRQTRESQFTVPYSTSKILFYIYIYIYVAREREREYYSIFEVLYTYIYIIHLNILI